MMSDNDDVHTVHPIYLSFPSNFVCSFPSQYPDISNFFNLWGVVTMEHTRVRDIMHGQEQKNLNYKTDEVGNKHMVSIMRAL